ncbi:unnamed protein product [Ambrosiozyma monospora]|uniref:Unnamed protein product n=1 Tax=Ambrosiozyma monospora TaxID=43982 RepID=A0ACB5TL74_AMBMO|nr:unnamed protein product [Ambrosiozyma monospora]
MSSSTQVQKKKAESYPYVFPQNCQAYQSLLAETTTNIDSTSPFSRFWYGGKLDLAKVRLQTAPKPGDNLIKVAVRLVKNEGVLAAYSGLSASLLRQATYSTARFGVYEELKERMTKAGVQPSGIKLLGASMFAGAVGGLIGNPSDIVNIRMQNDKTLPKEQQRNYKHAIDGLIKITKDEGVSALLKVVLG